MPRAGFSASHKTTAESRVRGAVFLIDAEFKTQSVYGTTAAVPVDANGRTYTAYGDFISVGALTESESLSRDKVSISLSLTNPAMLAAAMGPAAEYRGRILRVYAQLVDPNFVPVHAPILLFIGTMENFEIDRSPSGDGRSQGSIQLNCRRVGLERFKNVEGLRMSHAQQQAEYPGDLGLEYTESLVKQQPVWLSRAFQEI